MSELGNETMEDTTNDKPPELKEAAISKTPPLRPKLTIHIPKDEEEEKKRRSILVMNKFEESEKEFNQLWDVPTTPKRPRFSPRRCKSLTPNPNRESVSSSVSVGIDHLNNLVRLMEQLGQLKDESSKLKKRVSYLEDMGALYKARCDLQLSARNQCDCAKRKSAADQGQHMGEAKEKHKLESKHGRLSADFVPPNTVEDNLDDIPNPGATRKRSQSVDSIDLIGSGIFVEETSELSGIVDFKKHGVNRLLDKQKLVDAKARIKKFAKWGHKVFAIKPDSVDISDEHPKDYRKRSKTIDLSAMQDDDPYLGVWMGPPEWVKESNISSDESVEKQEVYLMDRSKTPPPSHTPGTPSEGDAQHLDAENFDPGTLHLDGKKPGRKAWGRVRDILHTRKDSLKRKSWGKSKEADQTQLARSRSDEHIDSSLREALVLLPHETTSVKPNSPTPLSPLIPATVNPLNSPKQSPSVSMHRKTIQVPSSLIPTPPHSPITSKAKRQGASPHSSPRLLRKGKVSPQLTTIPSTDVSDSDKQFHDCLQANITDDFAKKMEAWEKLKSKNANRSSRSPRMSRRDGSAPSSPGVNITTRASFADLLPSNIDDLQKNLTESFNRKLDDWERKKFQKQKGERSRSLDRKSATETEDKNTYSLPKPKIKKEKSKQNRDHSASKPKNKKRNKQESLDNSETSMDKLTDEFAKRLREWEIKKGFASSGSEPSIRETMTKSLSFDHDVDTSSVERINPYLDVDDVILYRPKKELVDETTSIDSRFDCVRTLELKNSDLNQELHKRDTRISQLQDEVVKLQENSKKKPVSQTLPSPDVLNLSISVNELWRRVLELQEYGDSLAAEKKRLEDEAEVSEAEHDLRESQLLEALKEKEASISHGLTPPILCFHRDHMQSYVDKLIEQLKDLKLGIMERNHTIELLRHRLLMQEVNHLLTQTQTARHTVELKLLKHHSKKYVPRRWKTFSGMELWLADQLNKAGLEKSLGEAVKRCHKLRTSCLSFDKHVDEFRHGDLHMDDIGLERSYCAPDSPDALSSSPEVKFVNAEVQVQPITIDADTLTTPTGSRSSSCDPEVIVHNTKANLTKQQSIDEDTNIEVSFTVQIEHLDNGSIISKVESEDKKVVPDNIPPPHSAVMDLKRSHFSERPKRSPSPLNLTMDSAGHHSKKGGTVVEFALVSPVRTLKTAEELMHTSVRPPSTGLSKGSDKKTSKTLGSMHESSDAIGNFSIKQSCSDTKPGEIKTEKTPCNDQTKMGDSDNAKKSTDKIANDNKPGEPSDCVKENSVDTKDSTTVEVNLSLSQTNDNVTDKTWQDQPSDPKNNSDLTVKTNGDYISTKDSDPDKKLDDAANLAQTILRRQRRSQSPQVQEIARRLSLSLVPPEMSSPKSAPKEFASSTDSAGNTSKVNQLREQFTSDSAVTSDGGSRTSPNRTVVSNRKQSRESPKVGAVAKARGIFEKSDSECSPKVIANDVHEHDNAKISGAMSKHVEKVETPSEQTPKSKSSGAMSLDRAKKVFNRVTSRSSDRSRLRKSKTEEEPACVSTDDETEKKSKSRSRFLDNSWIQKGKKFFRGSNSESDGYDDSDLELDLDDEDELDL